MVDQLSERTRRIVGIWLLIGVFMILIQIIIGGITRLTGSGLSITKWEIVTGTIPPTNSQAWEEAFDLYKATPQYRLINKGMSLKEFKFIYFWEYIHRFWARLMGFVFALPFFYFLFKKMLTRQLILQLLMVILLASAVASFGWIMVASGLTDKPWVSPYKLTLHLSLALILFSYVLWLSLDLIRSKQEFLIATKPLKRMGSLLLLVLTIQIILGGLMSGMKAGLNYPTWPTMGGEWLPAALFVAEGSFKDFFSNEASLFAVTFIQFFHRLAAYLLTVLIFLFFTMGIGKVKDPLLKNGFYFLTGVVILQVVLGILTVLNSKGSIPVDLGTYHQAGAVLLLGGMIFIQYHLINNRPVEKQAAEKSNYAHLIDSTD